MEKLARDLDSRNYLIDQLNEEINALKAQRSAGGRREQQDGGSREGVIDKYAGPTECEMGTGKLCMGP